MVFAELHLGLKQMAGGVLARTLDCVAVLPQSHPQFVLHVAYPSLTI